MKSDSKLKFLRPIIEPNSQARLIARGPFLRASVLPLLTGIKYHTSPSLNAILSSQHRVQWQLKDLSPQNQYNSLMMQDFLAQSERNVFWFGRFPSTAEEEVSLRQRQLIGGNSKAW